MVVHPPNSLEKQEKKNRPLKRAENQSGSLYRISHSAGRTKTTWIDI
jgi:hypothetical protein